MQQLRRPATIGALAATCFASEKTAWDLVEAMQAAIHQGHAQYLKNRKGATWLRVAVRRDDAGRDYFQFLDKRGHECGASIRKAAVERWNLYAFRRLEALEGALGGAGRDEWFYPSFALRHKLAAGNVTRVTMGAPARIAG